MKTSNTRDTPLSGLIPLPIVNMTVVDSPYVLWLSGRGCDVTGRHDAARTLRYIAVQVKNPRVL